jgi:hypothetical protein
MSDVQLLFLILAFVYGWECAFWIERGSVVFRSWLGKNWQIAYPGILLGNQRGGVVLGHPIPPLGTFMASGELTLLLGPKGVSAAHFSEPNSPPFPRGKWFSWEEITKVTLKGKTILLNQQFFLKAASPSMAIQIRALFLKLKDLKIAEREKAIKEFVQEMFDTSRIKSIWKQFLEQTRYLPLATNGLFVHLFVLSPALIALVGLRSTWIVLLTAAMALSCTTAIFFHRAHKILFPTAEDERFTHFIILLLSPATAIRARDVLSRTLFEGCHPLAVAKVFVSDKVFSNEAREFVRQGRYPVRATALEASTQETQRHWNTLRQKMLEDFIRQNGLDPEQMVQAPERADETCLSYCPRCRAQFTTREGICTDCGGLQLVPFLSGRGLPFDGKGSYHQRVPI